MTELPELDVDSILDAWVVTGRVPKGGWTVPRLIEAIQEAARDEMREHARQVHARHDLGHDLGAWPHACALCEAFS